MIYGIGTDIVEIGRMVELYERHGVRGLGKLLASGEIEECRAANDIPRFLSKRFAAKEALGKALGTGIRAPLLLPAVRVVHDTLGKPGFAFEGELAQKMKEQGLVFHLSISDERDFAIAFVVVEKI